MSRPDPALAVGAVALAAAAVACRAAPEPEVPSATASPNARPELVQLLRDDIAAPRDPADGGGRAWLEAGAEAPVVAGSRGRFEIVYEAGPLGIAEGGRLFLQVSPFWSWSEPQLQLRDYPGYVTVETDADGIELRPSIVDRHLVAVRIAGRALAAGERIRMVYGAGDVGAFADRYAERGSRFWIAVDGDGDGVRSLIDRSPSVEVVAGPPARLHATVGSTARPGDPVRLTVAILDRAGNAGFPYDGDVLLELPAGLDGPSQLAFVGEDEGRRTVEVVPRRAGVYRIRAAAPDGLAAESNPLVVEPEPTRVLWGDLQIHSNLSDGTGSPRQLYRYARDVAALDVAALTDHDHWGMRFLDRHPSMWHRIAQRATEFDEPGRFVALLGYEWTSWMHGHRHVLFPGDDHTLLSSAGEGHDTPAELWEALRGTGAMTIAHHTAGEPVATDWSFAPPPDLETVVEVVSVHGSSEAADSPAVVRGARAGHFARDALDRGYRLGFVGSGDGHDGHPGLAHLGGQTGGLAAILAEKVDREAVLAALRERRVYATSGPRIVLRVELDGRPMGAVVAAGRGPRTLNARIVAPEPIARVDVVRSGSIASIDGERRRELIVEREVRDLRSGEYVYLRVLQRDGGLAWSSPFFVE